MDLHAPGRGRTKVLRYTDAQNALASRIGGVSAADAGSPKELPEGKAGDQRAATDAGCEEDQFFGDDLHSNSCPWRRRGLGDLSRLVVPCVSVSPAGTIRGFAAVYLRIYEYY